MQKVNLSKHSHSYAYLFVLFFKLLLFVKNYIENILFIEKNLYWYYPSTEGSLNSCESLWSITYEP